MYNIYSLIPGHSGALNGRYLTAGKRSPGYPVIYEGVQNRRFCEATRQICTENKIPVDYNGDWYSMPVKYKKIRAAQLEKAYGAAMLISAHTNASGNAWSNAKGLTVFIRKKPRWDKSARKKWENAVLFSEYLLNDLGEAGRGVPIRGIKYSNLSILTGSTSSILVERWFHTNLESCENASQLDDAIRLSLFRTMGYFNVK